MANAGSVDPAQRSFFKTCLMGTISDLKHDLKFCASQKRLTEFPHAMRIRWAQRKGKWMGYNRRPLNLDRPMETQ